MFCRNCGSEMNDNAVVCIKCGVAKNAAANYCPSCGNATNPEAVVCVNCGIGLKNQSGSGGIEGDKSKTTAGLFAIFLGHLGIHEFYLGDKKRAMYKIIATVAFVLLKLVGVDFLGFIGFVGVWIWNIYDAVMIFTGKRKDIDGNDLK